jgi:hypothetical protein
MGVRSGESAACRPSQDGSGAGTKWQQSPPWQAEAHRLKSYLSASPGDCYEPEEGRLPLLAPYHNLSIRCRCSFFGHVKADRLLPASQSVGGITIASVEVAFISLDDRLVIVWLCLAMPSRERKGPLARVSWRAFLLVE